MGITRYFQLVTPLLHRGLTKDMYRLYAKGRALGYKRGKRNQRPNTSLVEIAGVATKEEAQFYLGKVR